MKLFIKTFLVFFVTMTSVYFALIVTFGLWVNQKYKPNIIYKRGEYGHLFSRLAEVKKTGKVDVLVLGSSHAYRGVDPRVLRAHGITAFNLGSSSQSPIQTNYLLKRYLTLLKPKLIIYDVFPMTLSSDGVESTLDFIANDKLNFDLVKMAVNTRNIKVYNSLIFSLFNTLVCRKQNFVEPVQKGNDTYVTGGFVEKKIIYHPSELFKKKPFLLKKEQVEIFEKTCKFAKEKNTNILLVNAPACSSFYKSYSNFDSIDQMMAQYAPYINFNKTLHLNDSLDFFDAHHLNQNGVIIYSNALAERCKPFLK